VLYSCENKYYGTNVIYAVPISLSIAPGLRTFQFSFAYGRRQSSLPKALKPLFVPDKYRTNELLPDKLLPDKLLSDKF
jgi:hypothetical protein